MPSRACVSEAEQNDTSRRPLTYRKGGVRIPGPNSLLFPPRVTVLVVYADRPSMEGFKIDSETRAATSSVPKDNPLRWPPPGLERLQGDLWIIIQTSTLAALILVFPLLLAVSVEQPFWSPGTLGSAWWIILITIGLGTGFLLESMVTLTRLLRRSRKAVERGYAWKTVAHVAEPVNDNGTLFGIN